MSTARPPADKEGALYCATCASAHPYGQDWSLAKVAALVKAAEGEETAPLRGDLVWFGTHFRHHLVIRAKAV